MLDLDVFFVRRIKRFRHAPLIERENPARLENAVDLREALADVTRMARCLDGVRSIKAAIGQRHIAEIFLQAFLQTLHLHNKNLRQKLLNEQSQWSHTLELSVVRHTQPFQEPPTSWYCTKC